jgi:hypothetical protein
MLGMPKCICAMITSDVVSDDDNVDDWLESDKDHVEPREGDLESADDVMSDDDCRNVVGATDNCLHWRGQDKMW